MCKITKKIRYFKTFFGIIYNKMIIMKLDESKIQSVVKQTINEYFEKEFMMPLKNRLKNDKLKQTCYFDINNIIDDISEKGYKLSDEGYERLEDILADNCREASPIVITMNVLDVLIKEFGRDVAEKLIEPYRFDDHSRKPENALEFIREIKNGWLIHFSKAAYDIVNRGYRYGIESIEDVAYSNLVSRMEKAFKNGYMYAYSIDNIPDDATKFGKHAVLFQGNGIEVYHRGDDEAQVICHNQGIKNCIYIENNKEYMIGDCDDEWCIRSLVTGEVLFSDDNIENVIQWAISNFAQYRKHLINPRFNKIQHDFINNTPQHGFNNMK